MKPFARSGDGGLWVILNDCFVGYIGTEGECGIVARNIDEFMNIISMYRGNVFDLFDINVLKSVDNFKKILKKYIKIVNIMKFFGCLLINIILNIILMKYIKQLN